MITSQSALSLYNQAIKILGTERSSDQNSWSQSQTLHGWMIVPCTAVSR